MASGFQFITHAEFKEIYRLAGLSMAQEQKILSMPPIDQILSLCKAYQKMLNSVAKVSQNKKDSYSVGIKSGKEDRYREVQVFGAKLSFRIRKFLLDEEIYFLLGAKGPTGKFYESKIDQETMLKNIRGSISNSAVVLTNGIDKAENMQLMASHVADLWQQILSWAIFEKGDTTEPTASDMVPSKDPKDRTRPIYQHLSKDSMAYLGYAGANHKRLYYYGKEHKFYNQGWLYEWYRSKSQDEAQLEILASQMIGDEHPLRFIFQGMDNIPGIQGGDFFNVAERQQVQAKYGNIKIMSFNNIIVTINEIVKLLTQYKSIVANEPAQGKALGLQIAKVFTHQNTINEEYDKIVDGILKKLK